MSNSAGPVNIKLVDEIPGALYFKVTDDGVPTYIEGNSGGGGTPPGTLCTLRNESGGNVLMLIYDNDCNTMARFTFPSNNEMLIARNVKFGPSKSLAPQYHIENDQGTTVCEPITDTEHDAVYFMLTQNSSGVSFNLCKD